MKITKVRLVLVLCIVAIGLTFVLFNKFNNPVKEENTTDRGVVSYINSFLSGDFETCDTMVQNSSEHLYSVKVLSNLEDEDYYKTTLTKLVDSIESVGIVGVVKKSSTEREYRICVEYCPYFEIDELDYDINALNDIKEQMNTGKYGNSDIEKALNKAYYDIFTNSCFKQDTGIGTKEVIVTLVENKQKGVVSIQNTIEFVDILLDKTNIQNNISVYEDNVKEVIEEIIKTN